MSTELTKQDRCDWNLHKAVCRRHRDGIIETAKSLKIIRDRKLWRVEYESFEAFAEGMYGRSLRWAQMMISDSSSNDVDAARTKPAPALPPGEQCATIAQSGPGATENGDVAPDATENAVSEPPAEPTTPPKPPDPFKKLDDLIGKAIRATDDIGVDDHHTKVMRLFSQLLDEIKRWRAVG